VLLVLASGCGLTSGSPMVDDVSPGSIGRGEPLRGADLTVTSKSFTESLVLGAMLGIAWARMSGLRRDIDLARKELAEAKRIFGRSPRSGEAPGAVVPPPRVVEHRLPDIDASALPAAPPAPASAVDAGSPPPVPPAPPRDIPGPVPPPVPPRPTWLDALIHRVGAWFTEGNVPVKIGMLVLFAGVAALLKYASDAGMFHAPVSVRVALVAVKSGNADAAIVYRTDSPGIVLDGPPAISYPAAVLRESASPNEARRFVEFLRSIDAKRIFIKYGFIPK